MVYDPKKTRAKLKDVEAVVDEIFEEVSNKVDSKLETAKKTVETKISDKKQKMDEVQAKILDFKESKEQKIEDKLTESSSPLYMQPQLWVTLAATAIVGLFIVKRLKNK